MKRGKYITLIGPCGIYCGDCEVYKAKDDPGINEVFDIQRYGERQVTLPELQTNGWKDQGLQKEAELRGWEIIKDGSFNG